MLIIITLATCVSTFLGGLFAIKFKDRLHLILGFSAGAVIGVAFFDLMPEAINLGSNGYSTSTITSIIALGFVLYMILDRSIMFHSHSEEDEHSHGHTHTSRGILGAGSLAIHSLLDGVAIGLAFQVLPSVGVIVAIAVLVHDFSDGINTVGFIMKDANNKKKALGWLIVDAIAPVVGVISTLFFTLPGSMLGIILALFSGFFLYIGASDLLPESHHSHPTIWTTTMTILGVLVLFIAIRLANI